ncbi:hypothetical protein KBD70_02205 [Candidatus Saccharibacteria bacterium]|nr:hypothetical protein [Candidatus Saccharibacteria bacterium]
MSKRNHYQEAKLPQHMRPLLLRDLEYDVPIYISLEDDKGGRDEEFYASTDKTNPNNDGRLWADGRMELERGDYEPLSVAGRVGLMLVMVVDGLSEKSVLLADLRFMNEDPISVEISHPASQEDEADWVDMIDNAISVEAFIACEENDNEAYFGPTGYKGDLERLRKYGDELLRRECARDAYDTKAGASVKPDIQRKKQNQPK